MKTYSFQTNDNFRIDVKASTPNSAYNKLKAIPNYANIINGNYFVYDKDGLHHWNLGWKNIKEETL
jgi:hypothetical protein